MDDALDEPAETIVVAIADVSNGVADGPQQVTATITDDDAPPSVRFTVAGQVGRREGDTLTATVQLSRPSGFDVTVPVSVLGSATAGVDYALTDAS
jgi:hypothetical protein